MIDDVYNICIHIDIVYIDYNHNSIKHFNKPGSENNYSWSSPK